LRKQPIAEILTTLAGGGAIPGIPEQPCVISVTAMRRDRFISILLIFLAMFYQADLQAAEKAGEVSPQGEIITLEQAIGMALKNNRALQNSALGVTSSDLNLKSQEAEFDFKITPQGSTNYSSVTDGIWQAGATVSKKISTGANLSVTPVTGETAGSLNSEIDVALSVPLLQGAGSDYAMSAVYSSVHANKSARLSFMKQQTDTVLQTVSAVYNSIQTQQQVTFLENQLKELNKHLSLARIKERSGIINAMDLYRAEIRIQSVEEALTSTREQFANNIDQVKEILAISQQESIIVAASVDYSPVRIDPAEAQRIALANRIELELSAMQVKEAERQVDVAKNRLLPQLDLRLGYNRYRDEEFDDLDEDRWTVALSTDTDLFRTTEKNEYEQSRISLRQIQLDQKGAEERIIQDVRFQLNTLEKQQERIRIRQEQARQAMGKLRLAESKFRHSLANNFDLLEAQTELQQAETDQMLESINYIIGTYRLRSSLGTLIDVTREEKTN
jgi:outer membrane protein TolC